MDDYISSDRIGVDNLVAPADLNEGVFILDGKKTAAVILPRMRRATAPKLVMEQRPETGLKQTAQQRMMARPLVMRSRMERIRMMVPETAPKRMTVLKLATALEQTVEPPRAEARLSTPTYRIFWSIRRISPFPSLTAI